ncbi:MAG: formylmethanofuran dehydrogenase subunit C [Planctomycetaceae bacterium]|nr:formylmethanofuran dehydrogenase subunit C [Planctomycetaceae bacterium]
MALEISTRQPLPCSMDLPKLDEALCEASAAKIAELYRVPIRLGKDSLEFGDLFSCRNVGPQPSLVWTGDTQRLNGVACDWRAGLVRVEGNVGDRAGSAMRGGRLEVAGSAGHWLACDLKGGTIVVEGNCGQFAAASQPAQRRGILGGVLVVRGSAGSGLGRRMRRGMVVIEGDVDGPANEMLAGTMILGGRVSGGIGTLMKRGTIVCLQEPNELQSAGLSRGITIEPLVWRLIRRHLEAQNVQLQQSTSGKFQLYHAPAFTGSRGEIWVAR